MSTVTRQRRFLTVYQSSRARLVLVKVIGEPPSSEEHVIKAWLAGVINGASRLQAALNSDALTLTQKYDLSKWFVCYGVDVAGYERVRELALHITKAADLAMIAALAPEDEVRYQLEYHEDPEVSAWLAWAMLRREPPLPSWIQSDARRTLSTLGVKAS